MECPVASRPREDRVRTGSHDRGGEWTGCLADPQIRPGVTTLAPPDDLDPVLVQEQHADGLTGDGWINRSRRTTVPISRDALQLMHASIVERDP